MTFIQTTLFSGETLRDAGIALACESAEAKEPGWNEQAYYLLREFITGCTVDFLCEDFRKYCERNNLTAPPSLRAYGGIIAKAYKQGLIRKVGYAQVSNPRAHMANCSRWINSQLIEGK